MGLSGIEHIGLDGLFQLVECFAAAGDTGTAGGIQIVNPCAQLGLVKLRQWQVDGPHRVMAHIGDNATKGAGHTGIPWHQTGIQPHLADQGTDMQCAATAKGHRRKLCRIVAAFN